MENIRSHYNRAFSYLSIELIHETSCTVRNFAHRQNDFLINKGEELLVEVAKKLETFYLSFGYNKIKGSGLKESIHTANPLTPKSPQTNRLPEVRIRNGAEGGL